LRALELLPQKPRRTRTQGRLLSSNVQNHCIRLCPYPSRAEVYSKSESVKVPINTVTAKVGTESQEGRLPDLSGVDPSSRSLATMWLCRATQQTTQRGVNGATLVSSMSETMTIEYGGLRVPEQVCCGSEMPYFHT